MQPTTTQVLTCAALSCMLLLYLQRRRLPTRRAAIEIRDEATVMLVADVDCTAEGQSLCSKHGVRGYPTVKFGSPTAMQKYIGGRDFESLAKFADEVLPDFAPESAPTTTEARDEV